MILSNIDFPQDLAKGLNETQEKAVKFLHSLIVNLDLNLQAAQSDIKQLKKADFTESVASAFSGLLKNIESNFEKQLLVHKGKMMSKFYTLEINFNELKDKLLTDYQNLNSHIGSEFSQHQKLLVETSKTLKAEILDLHLRPLAFELKENYKAIDNIERDVKVQTWNIEATHKELNSRFEMHKERINKVENSLQEFLKLSDKLIHQSLDPVKYEVDQSEKTIKELYSKFNDESDKILSELKSLDDKRQTKFNSNFSQIVQQKNDLEKMLKMVQSTRSLYLQDMNSSISKVNSEFEAFKSEARIIISNSFDKIRSDVLSSYKQEIKILQDKLRWLPAESENLSEMTQLEARLYTIETRIRGEESNRINQVNDLFQGNAY